MRDRKRKRSFSYYSPFNLINDPGIKLGGQFKISSEFTICHVVSHGIMSPIQNPSTVTNPTMEPYYFLLPLSYNVTNRNLTRDKSQIKPIWKLYNEWKKVNFNNKQVIDVPWGHLQKFTRNTYWCENRFRWWVEV